MSVISVLFITFLIYWVLRKWILTYISSYKIPGPWSIPLIGCIQTMPNLQPDKILSTLRDLRKRYGKTFRIWLGPKLWVFLHTPEETREALTNPTLVKPQVYHFMGPIFDDTLIMKNGKEWEHQRHLLNPSFNFKGLKIAQEKMALHSEIFIQNLSRNENNVLHVTKDLFNYVIDMIIDTFTGENVQIQLGNNSAYVHAIHRINELFFQRMMNPLLFPDFIYKITPMARDLDKSVKIVYDTTERIIQKRKDFLSTQNDDTCEILLDILIKASRDGSGFTEEHIRQEIDALLFAGVDTTSSALSFALYALAKYPKEQQKVFQEIQKVKSECKDGEHLKVLQNYEYLEMFIKESLRVYASVVITGRRTTCRTKIGQHTYEPGVDLWLNLYGVAHDPAYFEDPEQFRPERFSREMITPTSQFSYLVFAGGPRTCIGRKFALIIMKTMIIKILENFELSLPDPSIDEILLRVEMVLRPKRDIYIGYKKRPTEVL